MNTLPTPVIGISKLSLDVLTQIFEKCAMDKDELDWDKDWNADFEARPPYSTSLSSSASAVNVSHVCRQWYNLALGTASLWVSPTFTYKDDGMDFEILQRARDAPLKVRLEWTIAKLSYMNQARRGEWFTRFAKEFIARVERLWIRAPGVMVASLLKDIPTLRALYVQVADPAHLDGLSFPVLSTLHLEEMRDSSKIGAIFRGLTRLSLTYNSTNPHTMRQLLEVFPQNTNLVELIIVFHRRSSNWQDGDEQPTFRDPVFLPHLRYISLTGDFVCSTTVMRSLKFDRKRSKIKIKEHYEVGLDDEQREAFKAFVRSHSGTDDETFANNQVALTSTNQEAFCVEVNSWIMEAVTAFEINRKAYDFAGTWRLRIDNLMDYIFWDYLSVASLDIEDAHLAQSILELFHDCLGLEVIYLLSEPSFIAFTALHTEHMVRDFGANLFRPLRFLHIREVRMLRDEEKVSKELEEGITPKHGRLGALMNVLEDRLPQDRLDKIVLENCLFGSVDFSLITQRLLAYVNKVDIVGSG